MLGGALVVVATGFLLAANAVLDPSTAADTEGPGPTTVGARPSDDARGAAARPAPTRVPLTPEPTTAPEAPAAMQTMINIMEDGRPDHSRATQRRLYLLAREHSTEKLDDEGAEPEGWAAGLGLLGYGSYAVHVEDTRKDAIRTAARALRLTGRPVGLLTWRGAHSWVMSGFEATADPAYTDRFTVTHVYIEDVWYPRISSIWGESRPPDARVPVDLLPEDYLPWDRPRVRQPDKDGRFVLVVPVLAEGAAPG